VGDVEISTSKWVGILLIDHGSKKQASNDRLDERIYQQNVDSNVIVKAAHMEIAEPSIPDGLASLLKEGVGE
jgi:sirohydrochlorin ferrochelatase